MASNHLPDQPVAPEGIDDLRETIEAASVLADAPVRFWTCLNSAHKTVTWDDDVASCDTCGLTSEMTQRRAALIRAHERRKIADEMAALRAERDLAVAHDRQPYPTAWAYDQACKALDTHRARAEAAEAKLARLDRLHQPRPVTEVLPCEAHRQFSSANAVASHVCPDCVSRPSLACKDIRCCLWPCEPHLVLHDETAETCAHRAGEPGEE